MSEHKVMRVLRELVWCADARECQRTSPGCFELAIAGELKRREPAALAVARAIILEADAVTTQTATEGGLREKDVPELLPTNAPRS